MAKWRSVALRLLDCFGIGRIEDASLCSRYGKAGTGYKQVFRSRTLLPSGTLGWGSRRSHFFSLLRDKGNHKNSYTESAQAFLKQDYFTYTFARMLWAPPISLTISFLSVQNRQAAAPENSFETSARVKKNDSVLQVPFYDNFSTFPSFEQKIPQLTFPYYV